jgi:hypothetical protein
MSAPHINLWFIFGKLSLLLQTLNDAMAIEAEVAAKQPVDLSRIAADIHDVATSLGLKLPAWADNSAMVLTFVQAGLNAVNATQSAAATQA